MLEALLHNAAIVSGRARERPALIKEEVRTIKCTTRMLEPERPDAFRQHPNRIGCSATAPGRLLQVSNLLYVGQTEIIRTS
jgi:hypothetical protein